MRQLGIILISSCCALPCANVTADPALTAHQVGTAFLATYPDQRYALHHRRRLPHYSRDYYDHAPWHYAPHPYHRPRPQHQPYFNLHGYASPTWRTPRTLRFHHRYR